MNSGVNNDNPTAGAAHGSDPCFGSGHAVEQDMAARDRVLLYTRGMELDPLSGVELACESLRRLAAKPGPGGVAEAMDELAGVLDEHGIRLEAHAPTGGRLACAPPIRRRCMLSEEMDITPLRNALRRLVGKAGKTVAPRPAPPSGCEETRSSVGREDGELEKRWERAGFWRRLILLALILLPSLAAGHIMHSLLPMSGIHSLRWCIVVLFAILFGWISLGFWSSLAGLAVMLRGYDRFAISSCPGAPSGTSSDPSSMQPFLSLPASARTALLFPVYNENAHAVAAGIRTVFQDLCRAGVSEHFDIFILSDSTSPEAWILEEEAWYRLCREENAFGKIFYRRRKSNLKRKSGNIADFCRRWGHDYRYMIVFDADSLMSAHTLASMVRIMEAHPSVGIVQTPPKAIKSHSFIARVQQFANHLYGPIFAAGLHFWQLNNAQYWGHNAIIRVEPFIRHCQLPSLPGRAPLGGEILSHDFVESALMRRAGYGVWLAYDLDGSYEQTPPSLIDELIRDRRWCQGNLQHSRLVFTRGFFPTHRALFVNGILSYGSALLWLFFLIASSVQAIADLIVVPDYFPTEASLFPSWPQYFPAWALGLLSSTLILLFLPKLLSILLVTLKGGARAFGGFFAMSASMLGEVVVSTFLAPVRMLFHSYFIIAALSGRGSGWNAQIRDGRGISWRDALRFHWWGTALGAAWGWLMYMVNPGFFLWLSPVVAGLILSIPLSVWTSRVNLGQGARKLGLFLTSVDVDPPAVLQNLELNLLDEPNGPFFMEPDKGFRRAMVIPAVFALHCSLLRRRRSEPSAKLQKLRALADRAVLNGPDSLSKSDKLLLLSSPETMPYLHRKIWSQDGEQAARWGICRGKRR